MENATDPMLVIKRRLGESVILRIGDMIIRVTIVENVKGHVRIGIQAPLSVAVSREDLVEQPLTQEGK